MKDVAKFVFMIFAVLFARVILSGFPFRSFGAGSLNSSEGELMGLPISCDESKIENEYKRYDFLY